MRRQWSAHSSVRRPASFHVLCMLACTTAALCALQAVQGVLPVAPCLCSLVQMGLEPMSVRFSWELWRGLFGWYCLVAAAIAALASRLALFPHSDWALQCLLYFFAWLSVTASAALLHQVESSMGVRPIVLTVLWRAVGPFVGLFLAFSTVPAPAQAVACVFGPTALYFGAVVLNNAEESGVDGVHWSTLFTPVPGAGVKVPLGAILLLQALDCALSIAVLHRVAAGNRLQQQQEGMSRGTQRPEAAPKDLPRMDPVGPAAPVEDVPAAVYRHRSLEAVGVCKVVAAHVFPPKCSRSMHAALKGRVRTKG